MGNFILYFGIGIFSGVVIGAIASFRSLVLLSLVDASGD